MRSADPALSTAANGGRQQPVDQPARGTQEVSVMKSIISRMGAGRQLAIAVSVVVAIAVGAVSLTAQRDRLNPDAEARIASLEAALARSEARVRTLEDIEKINKLQRAYGYYVDKGQWSQVADLFAEDSSVEIAARGVYLGRKGAERLFLHAFGGGKDGLAEGRLFNHFILQGIVDVDDRGVTAKGRWRVFAQVAQFKQSATWSEGVYENEYVKDAGIWKFSRMKFWPTYYTPFEAGWAVRNLPNNGPSDRFPPDRPPTDQAPVFPGVFVPPFHYKNPVTGR
jgi:hypothetical protein